MSLPAASMIDYKSYLASDHWRFIRAAAIWAARGRCMLCHNEKDLQVHHVDSAYDALFQEKVDDVLVVCGKCHRAYHEGRFPPGMPPARLEAPGGRHGS